MNVVVLAAVDDAGAAAATARADLGDEAFAEALAQGREMDLEPAVAFALENADRDAVRSGSQAGR